MDFEGNPLLASSTLASLNLNFLISVMTLKYLPETRNDLDSPEGRC